MGRNLRGQFNYAINKSFEDGHGTSKHSDKRNGVQDGSKIYSYSTRNQRLDVSNQFASWMKDNHSEVKKATQVNSSHVQGFLLDKSKNCSNETLNQYRSQLLGLGKNINRIFNGNVDLSCSKVSGNQSKSIRVNPMLKKDFNRLKESYKPYTTGFNALTITSAGGCRVSELSKLKNKDITIGKDREVATIFVKDGKGGRDRTIIVTDKDRIKELEDLKNNLGGSEERVCPCQTGSLMKNLDRHMKQVGIKSCYQNQGFHSIRKMYAQNEYDAYRSSHTRQESLDYVSRQLGHGSDRDLKTLQRYITNIY